MIILRLHPGLRSSHFVTRMPEWGLSCILLAWGVQIVAHRDSFSTSIAYRQLGLIVPEHRWAYFAMTVASAWLVALTINGVVKRSRRWTPWIRSLSALLAFIFFAFNAVVFLLTIPTSPGIINNAGLAFLSLASSIIVAKEVGEADRDAKKCPPTRRNG